MIQVLNEAGQPPEGFDPARHLFLSAAGPGQSIKPLECFAGVPEFYLLHLVNPHFVDPQTTPRPDPAGPYRLRFTPQVGQSIHVPAAADTFTVTPAGGADQPAVIALGDIDGNGANDFIAAVREDVTVPDHHLRVWFSARRH
jgi:hypothetical protein